MNIMQSYDEIEGFEYWNTEAWRKLIKDYILPLRNSAATLLKLRDFILKIVEASSKATLSEIEKRRSDILQFLLGGIKEDGEYKDNSLAKLVRLTIGIYINPKEWITLEKEEGLRAFDYVYVKNEITPFLGFLKKLDEISSYMLKLIGEELKDILEIEEIIQKPEKMLEIIREIYVKCLQVSANHNYYTFFTLSTRTLPFKYMIMAYPKLQSNFDTLKEFLGLEKIFEPAIEEKLKEEYTIWGHSKDGLCNFLYELNNVIWENFSKENVKNVLSYVSSSLRDLKQEYAQKVQQKLEEIGWRFPEDIKASDRSYYLGKTKGVYCYRYMISGPILIKENSWGYSWRGNFYSSEKECSINLLKLIDDLSPALFLGSNLFELKLSGNMLEIVR
jgi:hypothetical protein